MLRQLLQLSEHKNWTHPIDAPETTILHGEIIRKKPFLKKLYNEWYSFFKKESQSLPQGKILELGSGAGFIKEYIPQAITTDVLELPNVDLVMWAENMQFDNSSVAGIFMIDVLHHIPKPSDFFKESIRTLAPGGKIIMVEPANTPWGRFIFNNFHHEPFEPQAGWEIPSTGPLSGANGALPWIIFERDRKKFEAEFPELRILSIRKHTPLRYLLSGGVSMKSLVPAFSFSIITFLEKIITTLTFGNFAMFQTIVLERRPVG